MSLCMIPKKKKSDMRTLALTMNIAEKEEKFSLIFQQQQLEEPTQQSYAVFFFGKREKVKDYTVETDGMFVESKWPQTEEESKTMRTKIMQSQPQLKKLLIRH